MNVLQLISSEGYYGAENVCVTLAAELRRMGVTSVVGAFRNSAKAVHLEVLEHAERAGVRTEEITCQGRYDRSAIQAIRSLIERHKIDVIHCHNIKANLYAWLLARYRNVALVSTCHGWCITSAKSWLLSVLDRCILHAMDRVVLVSDRMKPQIRRLGLRATVIFNGIDLKPFPHPTSDLRRKMNWGERPIIATICRLSPEKGLPYLLRAAAKVLQTYPSALLVLAGDGPDRVSLEREAIALGIQGSVCFLGIREDIPELLSCVDVLAISSVSEGLPMALLEAMASGRAVVASRVGAIPHVIRDRGNGILFSAGDVNGLADALRDLLQSKELRIALGRNARETVESRFSAAFMASQYLQVYREITYGRSLSPIGTQSHGTRVLRPPDGKALPD
jgi:glycosyltransferase involved in cell wall biosynthesis